MAVHLVLTAAPVLAGDVEVVHARFRSEAPGIWHVDVTLRHADAGWKHYADAWRVVSADNTVLGTRTLFHPHVSEQPFTRSLGGVRIPEELREVFVEAHDQVHGWSPRRIRVLLDQLSGEGFDVSR